MNLKDCKVLITETGLAVMAWPGNEWFQPFYCDNSGRFYRYMSDEEAGNLVQVDPPHLEMEKKDIFVVLPGK